MWGGRERVDDSHCREPVWGLKARRMEWGWERVRREEGVRAVWVMSSWGWRGVRQRGGEGEEEEGEEGGEGEREVRREWEEARRRVGGERVEEWKKWACDTCPRCEWCQSN